MSPATQAPPQRHEKVRLNDLSSDAQARQSSINALNTPWAPRMTGLTPPPGSPQALARYSPLTGVLFLMRVRPQLSSVHW